MAMKHERALAYAAFAVVCLVWGTTYLAIRVAIETLPTFLFSGARFTAAGVILLLICALRRDKIPTRLGDWMNAGFVGLMLVGVGNIAVVWAEHYVSSGFAALLVATAPFWMAIMERLRGTTDRLTPRKKLGMLIGFLGVAILVLPALDPRGINFMFLAGAGVLQLGSICWNYGSLRSKYHPIPASPLVSAGMQMLVGGLVVLMIGFARGEAASFHFTPRTLTAFLYLLVFGSVIAYGAYVYALAKLPTSTVSLYAYVNPAVAVFLGWLILGEPLGWSSLVAMIVIFAGVAMVQTQPRTKSAVVVPITEEPVPVVRVGSR
jgi:drug/metabolite transporter (DMT)-like permease